MSTLPGVRALDSSCYTAFRGYFPTGSKSGNYQFQIALNASAFSLCRLHLFGFGSYYTDTIKVIMHWLNELCGVGNARNVFVNLNSNTFLKLFDFIVLQTLARESAGRLKKHFRFVDGN